VIEDGVVVDIRVLWDSKSSEHNATLWAPGFMLPDCGNVEEHIIKWLDVLVRDYLDAGSPSQDYNLPTDTFIKSTQGDVDMGQMFNNFPTHKKECHSLGVRYITTNSADLSEDKHSMKRFDALYFGGHSSLW